jgi:hypothetical protein
MYLDENKDANGPLVKEFSLLIRDIRVKELAELQNNVATAQYNAQVEYKATMKKLQEHQKTIGEQEVMLVQRVRDEAAAMRSAIEGEMASVAKQTTSYLKALELQLASVANCLCSIDIDQAAHHTRLLQYGAAHVLNPVEAAEGPSMPDIRLSFCRASMMNICMGPKSPLPTVTVPPFKAVMGLFREFELERHQPCTTNGFNSPS